MDSDKKTPLKYIQLCLLEHNLESGNTINSRLEPDADNPDYVVLEVTFVDGTVQEWGIDVELLSEKKPAPKVIDRTFAGTGDGPPIPSGPVPWFAWDKRRPREETEVKVVAKTAYQARYDAAMQIPDSDPICIDVVLAK